MKTPLILLVVSAFICALGFLVPAWSDALLVGVPCAIASLWLLWRAWRAPNWVIVDGSNVMHWKKGVPDIGPVRDVLAVLAHQGFTAGVMFDANAGYKLFNKYKHDHAFSRLLDLPQNRIMVVPKGTPADPYILTAARDYKARIVTNDQFRDWVDDFPEILSPGFLIKGGYQNNQLLLGLS